MDSDSHKDGGNPHGAHNKSRACHSPKYKDRGDGCVKR